MQKNLVGDQKPQKPMTSKEIVGLMGVAARLKTVKRAGWNRKGSKDGLSKTRQVKDPEGVGDHTFSAAMLALTLMSRLGMDLFPDIKFRLLGMLLVHDLPEAIVGDQIVYDKDNIVDTEKRRLKNESERYAIQHIFSLYNAPQQWLEWWKEFDENKTPMAQLAHEIDKLDAVIQAYWYATRAGQQSQPQEFWDAARREIKHSALVKFLEEIPLAYSDSERKR